ncbi:uncharacterized protein LOC130112867 isoform X2 [Lampris incognitus]|nr:uncharacterized protein LOC130112867 isoform X2 [Lampris incognitus]
MWGCGAGHAYHWPMGYRGSSSGASANNNQDQNRFVGGRSTNEEAVKESFDLSCSEPASEAEEFSSRLFDMAGCDSSATDDDGDYEPRQSRKRGEALGAGTPVGSGGGQTKRFKQEVTSEEDCNIVANVAHGELTDIKTLPASQATHIQNSQMTHTLSAQKSPHSCSQPQLIAQLGEQGETLGCEGAVDSDVDLLGKGNGCSAETTDKTVGGISELDRLCALLCAERSRNNQLSETISDLRRDKELLQCELTKKAELICDFLQDQVRPEKNRPHSSSQMEPGSTHKTSDDVTPFDSPALFDSFEEVELHPLEPRRALKSKRSRDGENTRVRMKNVVGVIARYMAALQEFRRSVSMKVAFDRVGVDRNTISRTAAIAELSLAAPEVFHALKPWDEKEETLAHYAHRCRQAMDDNIKAKIKTMKAKGDLLPIVSK